MWPLDWKSFSTPYIHHSLQLHPPTLTVETVIHITTSWRVNEMLSLLSPTTKTIYFFSTSGNKKKVLQIGWLSRRSPFTITLAETTCATFQNVSVFCLWCLVPAATASDWKILLSRSWDIYGKSFPMEHFLLVNNERQIQQCSLLTYSSGLQLLYISQRDRIRVRNRRDINTGWLGQPEETITTHIILGRTLAVFKMNLPTFICGLSEKAREMPACRSIRSFIFNCIWNKVSLRKALRCLPDCLNKQIKILADKKKPRSSYIHYQFANITAVRLAFLLMFSLPCS